MQRAMARWFLLVLLMGCAVGESDGEVVEGSEQAVLKKQVFEIWRAGDGPKKLASYSSNFCFLELVAGKFESEDHWVNVFGQNGYWYVNGNSPKGANVEARVLCQPLNDHGQKWSFENGVLWSQGEGKKKLGAASKRACVLTAVGGDWRTDQMVHTYKSDGNWYVNGSSGNKHVWTLARCITGSNVSPGAEEWENHGNPVLLLDEAEGVCGLSRIQGNFKYVDSYVGLTYAINWSDVVELSGEVGNATTAQCLHFD